MGRTAIVFSGQGAQHPGMGQDLYDNFKCAKKLFDYAETVRPGTKEQCFSGTDEELKKTENTQPCLYLVDLAAAMALSSLGVRADGCAGFSLGEIAALAFSGAYSPEAGFNLVTERARLMQSASLEAETAMAAILKTDAGTVTSLCETLRGEGDEVYPVNFNSRADGHCRNGRGNRALYRAREGGRREGDPAKGQCGVPLALYGRCGA